MCIFFYEKKEKTFLSLIYKLGNDTIVNIEMQKDIKIMSKSLKIGESYNKLSKALAIWIIDYKEKEI